jgi:hypothetical protein
MLRDHPPGLAAGVVKEGKGALEERLPTEIRQ